MARHVLAVGLAALVALMIAEPAQGSVYASTFDGSLKLVRLDPTTLRPLAGRTVPLAREPLGWSFSPGRSRLVMGSTARGATLRFIELRRMRFLGGVTISRRGSGVATAWVGRARVLSVAVTPGCCGAGDTIVAGVDAERRRVLWRRRLGGSLQAGERVDGGLLLVLGPPGEALGPSRLVHVGAQGPTRSVALPEIISGIRPARPVTESWNPGLAVDQFGGRAFVVQAGAPVAEVDLRTFEVQSHPVQADARSADALTGPQRDALWLGRGTLAITGSDYADRAGGPILERPAGLTLVDTRRWVARKIDVRTDGAALVSGTLLTWSFTSASRSPGSGLTGLSRTGARRFHILGKARLTGVQPLGRTALVGSRRGITLIDVRSGRRLRHFSRFAMTLLRADAPFPG